MVILAGIECYPVHGKVAARFRSSGRTPLLLLALTFSVGRISMAQAPLGAATGGSDTVVIAAAGDLVCGTATPSRIPCYHAHTAELVRRLKPNALLLLGDLQYETGSKEDFEAYYEPAFGEFKGITFPVPGNHEYFTRGARAYFDYFNGTDADSGRAGSRQRGYYSFNLGAWHIVALNTNCVEVGGCGAQSPQARWLRADLAASAAKCTLAFSHSSRFSSGEHGNDEMIRDLWQILYDAGADVVVSAHDHTYERFAPQDHLGRRDANRGLRAFVVGTGGKGTARFAQVRPNSELRDNSSVGFLTMTLRPDGYSWRFLPVPGLTLEDAGEGTCHD